MGGKEEYIFVWSGEAGIYCVECYQERIARA